MPTKKLLLGLSFAILASAQLPIPIFSTGQGVAAATADPHWTYNLPSFSLSGNPLVLSPGNVAGAWAAPSGNAQWVSTCDRTDTLNCLSGPPTASTTVTYTTTFSLTGLDPGSASLTINWTTDDCGGAVKLNGVVQDPGFGCGLWTTTHAVTINSGFQDGTNTLSFTTTNADNGFEGIMVDVTGTANPAGATQVSYAANLTAGDSLVNLTNAGTALSGNICANVYVFAEDEQLIACCSCPLTPDGLATLSVQKDLISNTLTAGVPSAITTVLLASSGTCSAGSPGPLAPGLRAWSTTLHAAPGGKFAVTEDRFLDFTLSKTEFARLTQTCGFIEANGSGYGICASCRAGAAGGNKK